MAVKKIVIYPIKNWDHSAILKLPLPGGAVLSYIHDPKSDQSQTYECDFTYDSDSSLEGKLFTKPRDPDHGFTVFGFFPEKNAEELHIHIGAQGPALVFAMFITTS